MSHQIRPFLLATKVDDEAPTSRWFSQCQKFINELFGNDLTVMTAVEPWRFQGPMVLENVSEKEDLVEKWLEEKVTKTRKALEQFINTDQISELIVRPGLPATEILKVAKEINACAIVLHSKSVDFSYLLKSFSTILTLLQDSKTPVLILPEDFKPVKVSAAKILIGDNLSADFSSKLEANTGVLRKVSRAKWHHLHIYPDDRKDLEEFVTYIQGAMAKGMLDPDPDFSIDKVTKQIEEQVTSELRERSKKLTETADNITYETRLGDVGSNIEDIVKSGDFDLLVFGRHEAVHKPLSFGKLSFRTMLNLHRPLLIL